MRSVTILDKACGILTKGLGLKNAYCHRRVHIIAIVIVVFITLLRLFSAPWPFRIKLVSLCRVWLPPPSFPLGDMTSMVWDGKVYNTVSVGGHLETIWAEEGTTLWCGWQNKVMLISLLRENNVYIFARKQLFLKLTHKTNRCTRSPRGATRSGKSVR